MNPYQKILGAGVLGVTGIITMSGVSTDYKTATGHLRHKLQVEIGQTQADSARIERERSGVHFEAELRKDSPNLTVRITGNKDLCVGKIYKITPESALVIAEEFNSPTGKGCWKSYLIDNTEQDKRELTTGANFLLGKYL